MKIVAPVLSLLTLAACGSPAVESPHATPGASLGATVLSSPSPNNESDKPAADILADSARQLHTVSTFHITGMITDGVALDAWVSGDDLSGSITTHNLTWNVIVHSHDVFFQGQSLWQATQPASVAATLGDHWVMMSPADSYWGLVTTAANIRTLSVNTVFSPRHDLTVRGQQIVDGVNTVWLANDNDGYWTASDGLPYPIRWTDLAEEREGQTCSLDFDGFTRPVTIIPPTDALTLDKVGGRTWPIRSGSA